MIKIGIIGAGPNAADHARYFHTSPRTVVAWVADPNAERAHALAEECSARPLTDFRVALCDADAVVVSSPNFLHREHAIVSAQAGRHVYCEKPMGLSLGEAHEIADAVQTAGVRSQVGFSVRFDSETQTMLRKAQAGELGQIVAITSRRLMCLEDAPASSWRRDAALSGGLLLEVNVHEIEWMMALGGSVETVYARTWAAGRADAGGSRANDHVWATLSFADGATGMHEGGWHSPNPQFFRSVAGTKAGLSTNEWGNTLYYARLGEDREEVTFDASYDLRGNFLDAIERGTPTVAGSDWGLKVMAVVEAVFESAASGQAVSVKQGRQH